MSETPRKPTRNWSRIEPVSDTVLAPQISAIHFRRVMVEALNDDLCGDVCPNNADVVLKEVPVTLVINDGSRVRLPEKMDFDYLKSALSALKLTEEQIEFLLNSRRRLALCLGCARRRILDK